MLIASSSLRFFTCRGESLESDDQSQRCNLSPSEFQFCNSSMESYNSARILEFLFRSILKSFFSNVFNNQKYAWSKSNQSIKNSIQLKIKFKSE